MSFKYVELFAGIGGFRSALDKLGGECVFASEIDKFAVKSYDALYNEKPEGDITKIKASSIPDHDLLVGGTPCQPFSVSGKRAGFEDSRGTLFFEVARIAKEKKPKVILLENVKGLISHDSGKTLKLMLEILNEIGYAVDFQVLNSKYYGVPQNRERIFIVAVRENLGFDGYWETDKKGVVGKAKNRLSNLEHFNFEYPNNSEVTTRLREVLEPVVDEKYFISEEKTEKLLKQLKGELLPGDVRAVLTPDRVEKRQNGRRFKDNDEEAFTLTAQDRHGVCVVGSLDIKGNDQIKRVYDPDGISPTLTTMQGGNRQPKVLLYPRIRKLTPLETWRLQGFTDEQFYKAQAVNSNAQLYKQSGNAVTVNVIEAIGERFLKYL